MTVDRGLPDPLGATPHPQARVVTRAIKATLISIPDAVSVAVIEHAIAVRDPRSAETALKPHRIDASDVAPALVAVVNAEGKKVGSGFGKATARASFIFDLENPEAGAWADKRAADLVVEISESTRGAIRRLVATAVREGGNPREIAPVIRGMVGLHSRWAQAVFNYRTSQETAGISGDALASRVGRYYSRLLSVRSKTIARTEVLRASNEGKLAAWNQAADLGLFGGTTPTKTWVASGDACPVCADLDGTEVGLDEDFSTEYGDVPVPPAHPNCRCTAVARGRKAAA